MFICQVRSFPGPFSKQKGHTKILMFIFYLECQDPDDDACIPDGHLIPGLSKYYNCYCKVIITAIGAGWETRCDNPGK